MNRTTNTVAVEKPLKSMPGNHKYSPDIKVSFLLSLALKRHTEQETLHSIDNSVPSLNKKAF